MSEALKKVSAGFKLVYIGLLLVVLAVVIGIVGAMVLVGGAAGGGNVGGAMQMLFGLLVLVGGLSLAGKVVGLVGRFKCMAIPEQAGGARQMIVVSVATELVSLGITLLVLASDLTGNFLGEGPRTIVNAGGLILSLISTVLFLLFTRAAADFVRRPDLSATAMSVLWLWVLTIVLYIVAVAIVAVVGVAGAQGRGGANAAGGGACVGGLLMLAALVIGLVALIRYANLLTGMATATMKYARSGAYDYDEEYEDDRPRGRGRYDDDEEEDRPRRSRRDDDEDEDDRPRKKRRDDDEWES